MPFVCPDWPAIAANQRGAFQARVARRAAIVDGDDVGPGDPQLLQHAQADSAQPAQDKMLVHGTPRSRNPSQRVTGFDSIFAVPIARFG